MTDKCLTVEDRFWSKVGYTDYDGCWRWKGTISDTGYGVLSINHKPNYAHRLAYQFMIGQIPEGLTLDHLCRNRTCVNPAHLEPVTAGENVLRGNSLNAINKRKTICVHGHPLSGDNLYTRPDNGNRQCKTCKAITIRRWWRRYN